MRSEPTEQNNTHCTDPQSYVITPSDERKMKKKNAYYLTNNSFQHSFFLNKNRCQKKKKQQRRQTDRSATGKTASKSEPFSAS